MKDVSSLTMNLLIVTLGKKNTLELQLRDDPLSKCNWASIHGTYLNKVREREKIHMNKNQSAVI